MVRSESGKSKCTPRKVKNCIKTFLVHLFSHVGLCVLVVGYAVIGGVIFKELEYKEERKELDRFEKAKIDWELRFNQSRREYVGNLWNITDRFNVLYKFNWTQEVETELEKFGRFIINENSKILKEVRSPQWTFTQALLYSVSIITTIGYGNTAPKTFAGKMFTMFYAVIGVPLMLLWVSNIGNVMAKTFKFAYFHSPFCSNSSGPKINKTNSVRKSTKNKNRKDSKKLKKESDKSKEISPVILKETQVDILDGDSTQTSIFLARKDSIKNENRLKIAELDSESKEILTTCANYNLSFNKNDENEESRAVLRELSLDASIQILPPPPQTSAPIDFIVSPPPPKDLIIKENEPSFEDKNKESELKNREKDENISVIENREEEINSAPLFVKRRFKKKNRASVNMTPSKLPLLISEDNSEEVEKSFSKYDSIEEIVIETNDDIGPKMTKSEQEDRVPVSLVLFVVVLYIVLGAGVFTTQENWDFWDSAYFCFITLSTIGLGDLTPGKSLEHSGTRESTVQLVFCCFYLVVGLAIIAMSFNLVQEQVRVKVLEFARRIGIIEDV